MGCVLGAACGRCNCENKWENRKCELRMAAQRRRENRRRCKCNYWRPRCLRIRRKISTCKCTHINCCPPPRPHPPCKCKKNQTATKLKLKSPEPRRSRIIFCHGFPCYKSSCSDKSLLRGSDSSCSKLFCSGKASPRLKMSGRASSPAITCNTCDACIRPAKRDVSCGTCDPCKKDKSIPLRLQGPQTRIPPPITCNTCDPCKEGKYTQKSKLSMPEIDCNTCGPCKQMASTMCQTSKSVNFGQKLYHVPPPNRPNTPIKMSSSGCQTMPCSKIPAPRSPSPAMRSPMRSGYRSPSSLPQSPHLPRSNANHQLKMSGSTQDDYFSGCKDLVPVRVCTADVNSPDQKKICRFTVDAYFI